MYIYKFKHKLRNNKYLSATEVIDDWLDYEDCENDEQFYRQIKDLIIFWGYCLNGSLSSTNTGLAQLPMYFFLYDI